jgi:hypothetical protein
MKPPCTSYRRSRDASHERVIDFRSAYPNAKGRSLYQFGLRLWPGGQGVIRHTGEDSAGLAQRDWQTQRRRATALIGLLATNAGHVFKLQSALRNRAPNDPYINAFASELKRISGPPHAIRQKRKPFRN